MKVKPSEQLKRETEKNVVMAKTDYVKQMERNKEAIKANNDMFIKKKKQFHFCKRKKKRQMRARL